MSGRVEIHCSDDKEVEISSASGRFPNFDSTYRHWQSVGPGVEFQHDLNRDRDYSRVPGDRNWHIETAGWNLAGFFTIFRNLLAGIWGSFLRFIETGFRNWLAAFLGFSYDFSTMSMIFL